jgi:hypothetical protein
MVKDGLNPSWYGSGPGVHGIRDIFLFILAGDIFLCVRLSKSR